MSIIDFGPDTSLEEASLYSKPLEHVLSVVEAHRTFSVTKALGQGGGGLGRSRPELRTALLGKNRFICTPRVAKHRIFVWVFSETLPDSRLYALQDDDYFFGILHSKLHEVWSLATSSRHGDGDEGGRPTYNNTTCFETFPFPWPPGTEPQDDARVDALPKRPAA